MKLTRNLFIAGGAGCIGYGLSEKKDLMLNFRNLLFPKISSDQPSPADPSEKTITGALSGAGKAFSDLVITKLEVTARDLNSEKEALESKKPTPKASSAESKAPPLPSQGNKTGQIAGAVSGTLIVAGTVLGCLSGEATSVGSAIGLGVSIGAYFIRPIYDNMRGVQTEKPEPKPKE